MSNYHIAANGKMAACKAQPGACPLGGTHGSKDQMNFYIETRQALGLDVQAAKPVAPKRSLGVALALLANEDITKRVKALNAFDAAEKTGDEETINDAAARLEVLGEDVSDPTWNVMNLQREAARRRRDTAAAA